MNKELEFNKLNLLCLAIIDKFEEMEDEGLIFHKQKQIGKRFVTELVKVTGVICGVASETDNSNYKEALNDVHLSLNKLNKFMDEMYLKS
jgi:hypothetical protein